MAPPRNPAREAPPLFGLTGGRASRNAFLGGAWERGGAGLLELAYGQPDMTESAMNSLDTFDRHRQLLFGIAYRMLKM